MLCWWKGAPTRRLRSLSEAHHTKHGGDGAEAGDPKAQRLSVLLVRPNLGGQKRSLRGLGGKGGLIWAAPPSLSPSRPRIKSIFSKSGTLLSLLLSMVAKSISHRFEAMESHCVLVFRGNHDSRVSYPQYDSSDMTNP